MNYLKQVWYAEVFRYSRRLSRRETKAMVVHKSVLVGHWGVHMPLGVFTSITLAKRKKQTNKLTNLSWNKHNYFFPSN